MLENKNFVNLHTHSFYSILEASANVQSIVEKAKSLGCPAVGLTDVASGYGLVEFYEAAAKSGDIKPIMGAEVFVARNSRFERRAGIDGREGYLVLLAKNQTGWENLLQIISKSFVEGFYYKGRADWEVLEKFSDGLIVLTGGTGGLIGRSFSEFGEQKVVETLDKIKSVFGEENVFMELVARTYPEQVELNKYLVQNFKDEKFVATSDARYLAESDYEAADTLSCIGRNAQVHDEHRFKFAENNWFKTWEEICADLEFVDDDILETARENTLKVSDLIDLKIEFGRDLLPKYAVREGQTEKGQLLENCEIGMRKRFPRKKDFDENVYRERLDYELGIISKMGFDAYFLIVQDFIVFARANGIAVGPGRGSAAGSLVSYLLGITNIDPIAYELLFERFLNPERISMPDIDIDFSDERREEVMQYVIEKYGEERVSKVCTFGTLAAKAALKDVGRAHGIPFAEMNKLTKVMPNTPGIKLADMETIPDFKALLSNEKIKKVYDIARQLEGCVRHVSVHACAVMIAPYDLSKFAPIQWAPGAEDIKITQFPYQQLEHIGLLKMDFLGLKNLSILEKAVHNIKLTTGDVVVLDGIPIDDEKTFQMMAAGETTGVFQFESAGMRRYLKELKPTEFEDLVAMNALYRPGPMEYIPQYIRGKHDPKSVKYLDDSLEPLLRKTYGIAVYQEQVLRIAQDFAGFSLGEADLLRKAIGKKIMSILAEQREKFISGAVNKGFPKKLAVKIFDDIVVPFSGYGFNRSHAVCYARIAYETAYLRANYPVEFMAAMMTTDRNVTDRIVLEMNECGEMGIEVLPPSVNESGSYFTVIMKDDPAQTSLKENTEKSEEDSEEEGKDKDKKEHDKVIRFGLTAIKGLGEDTVDLIIKERDSGGAFKSLQDFAKRVPAKLMNKKTLEALAFSGAFDKFANRGAIVESLDALAKFAKDFQEKESAGQMGLFGGMDESAIDFTLNDVEAEKDDILRWERESLGMFVSDHPLKGLGEYFEKYGTLIGRLTKENDLEKKRTVHGLVIAVRKIVTKRGKNMAILEIEDTSGKIECAVFPGIFDKVPSRALEMDAFIRVMGKVDERDDNLNMIVDDIKVGDLKDVRNSMEIFGPDKLQVKKGADAPFVIQIPDGTTKAKVDELKNVLSRVKSIRVGARSVEIYISGRKVELPFKVDFSEVLEKRVEGILK